VTKLNLEKTQIVSSYKGRRHDDDDNDDDDDNKRMQRFVIFYPFINAEFGSKPQKLCHDFPKVLEKRRVSVYLSRPPSPNLHRFSAFENTRGK
jgi:hypothetical protein